MSEELVDPFECEMWEMHDRLGEEVTAESCMSLIRSIEKHGQKQPALGRRVNKPKGQAVELIYGARRLFAARYLGIPLLVVLRNLDTRAALIEMDIENRVRTDISPYERGLSYSRWLRRGHFSSQVEIARALRVSEAQISRLLRFAELPAVVLQAFPSPSDIREEWAVVLARRLTDPERRERLLRRARACKGAGARLSAQAAYEVLLSEGPGPARPVRARDEIIKDAKGAPLLRVRFRTKAVHLIVPKERVSASTLREITEGVKVMIESARPPADAK